MYDFVQIAIEAEFNVPYPPYKRPESKRPIRWIFP
jgi:hypothetical protein